MLATTLPFFVIIPVIIAVFLYVSAGLKLKSARIIALIAQLAFVVLAFSLLLATRSGEIINNVGGYEGFLGITLRADTLASAFVFLTAVIFLAVVIYNLRSPYDHTGRLYWLLLFLLEGALLGLFLTRDFFNVFVLVEVSTVVIVILLMYDRERRNLFAGMTFIMVNIVVMQFYLFGIGYIYMVTGVMDMEAASAVIATMDRADLVLPYALIMTSIAAKCSLLPLLTWLPKVNSLTGARFTVMAIMSGLHIKSGVYLFIRMQDVFGGMASELWLVLGIVTAIAGIILALAQKDIRLMLAYSTIAQVGLIVSGVSLYSQYSFVGGIFHIVNHALFKVALFLAAGIISYFYQTKDITKMRGLIRHNPAMAVANALAVLGIMGAPLFNGSISKYFLVYGATGAVEWVFIAINFGTILVFVRYSAIFFGKPPALKEGIRPDWCRQSLVLGLGIFCFALGIFGGQAIDFLFNFPVQVSVGGYIEKSLIFAVSLVTAVFFYKFVFVKWDMLARLRGLELSFKVMIMTIGLCFVLLLVYVGVLGEWDGIRQLLSGGNI